MLGIVALVLYILTIPLANWMLGHIGVVCPIDSPCLIPVWPGLMAPSGVIVIGAALVLRDAVQRELGNVWALRAIVIGCAVSWLVAPPVLVIASVTAFGFSELADFVVYTPLAKRKLWLAVLLSGVVGSIVDSLLFLQLAFGSVEYAQGQIVGKLLISVVAACGVWLWSH